MSYNALKRDAGGKKGKLLCCKCIFDRIKGTCNLAEHQPKNHQNVQKNPLFAKVPRVKIIEIRFLKMFYYAHFLISQIHYPVKHQNT